MNLNIHRHLYCWMTLVGLQSIHHLQDPWSDSSHIPHILQILVLYTWQLKMAAITEPEGVRKTHNKLLHPWSNGYWLGLVWIQCDVSSARSLVWLLLCIEQWEYTCFFKIAASAQLKLVSKTKDKFVHPPSNIFQMALVWALQHAPSLRSIVWQLFPAKSVFWQPSFFKMADICHLSEYQNTRHFGGRGTYLCTFIPSFTSKLSSTTKG